GTFEVGTVTATGGCTATTRILVHGANGFTLTRRFVTDCTPVRYPACTRQKGGFFESRLGDRRVEERQLFLVGRLKDRCPRLEVSRRHRRGAPLARCSASLSSLDQLVQRRLEEMKLDSHPQGASSESLLVSFSTRPMAPLQDHALTVREELLRKSPQLCFEK